MHDVDLPFPLFESEFLVCGAAGGPGLVRVQYLCDVVLHELEQQWERFLSHLEGEAQWAELRAES